MTEYAAIRIDFTLQGVVHMYPLATNPARSDLTISEAPAYRSTPKSEINRYSTILCPQVGMQPLRGWGALELCGSPPAIRSSTKRPCSSSIGPPQHYPTPDRSGDAHS